MKRLSVLLAAGLLLILPSCNQSFLSRIQEVHHLESGAVLSRAETPQATGIFGEWETELFDSHQSIAFIRINPQVYTLDIFCGEGAAADSTSALCTRNAALAGINGSYFDIKKLSHATFIRDNGRVSASTDSSETFRTNGAFCSRADSLYICSISALPEDAWETMASGPLLMDEGEVITYSEGIEGWDGFYNRRHPRSLIGTDADGFIWFVVVDGRAKGKADGMTIDELTQLAVMMGLSDALNLDGGGSSTLWSSVAGVLNHPCDNHRFDHVGQRVVPNVISVKKR